MAVGDQELGIVRIFGEELFIVADRFIVAPKLVEDDDGGLDLGRRDEDLRRDGLGELVVIAARVGAVGLQLLGLVGPLVGLAAEVRPVGQPGDDPSFQPLTIGG